MQMATHCGVFLTFESVDRRQCFLTLNCTVPPLLPLECGVMLSASGPHSGEVERVINPRHEPPRIPANSKVGPSLAVHSIDFPFALELSFGWSCWSGIWFIILSRSCLTLSCSRSWYQHRFNKKICAHIIYAYIRVLCIMSVAWQAQSQGLAWFCCPDGHTTLAP